MSDFSSPDFHDDAKAREWLETRLWPNGPIFPKSGAIGEATLMKGKTTRPGLYKCRACRDPFTVTMGTIYERTHIPLHKWLAATQLMMASKKGMSALQVHRLLGITPRSAWFMCHRIRESLRETKPEMLGGDNSAWSRLTKPTSVAKRRTNARTSAPTKGADQLPRSRHLASRARWARALFPCAGSVRQDATPDPQDADRRRDVPNDR